MFCAQDTYPYFAHLNVPVHSTRWMTCRRCSLVQIFCAISNRGGARNLWKNEILRNKIQILISLNSIKCSKLAISSVKYAFWYIEREKSWSGKTTMLKIWTLWPASASERIFTVSTAKGRLWAVVTGRCYNRWKFAQWRLQGAL